jgi:tRNA (mo5U34)-methyltransferase
MGKIDIQQRVIELGDWFHNLNLEGVQTAPHHFLGDYPSIKWRTFEHLIPNDLSGCSVLDIGCNAGFYSIEMKRRGAARVLGVDLDVDYLKQAKFAARILDVEIEFKQCSVYDIADLKERFDYVFFMGVFYHLRHPLLALDLISEHVVKSKFVFQSMVRGSGKVLNLKDNYDFSEINIFDEPGFPKMHFIEDKYSGDETNWWIPNGPCIEAMLRSSGFKIVSHPENEVYICQKD